MKCRERNALNEMSRMKCWEQNDQEQLSELRCLEWNVTNETSYEIVASDDDIFLLNSNRFVGQRLVEESFDLSVEAVDVEVENRSTMIVAV